MSTPYIGEIRIFGGNFAPLGWALCDGQLLAIAQYDALFALIGTTYGGDGQTTFALPDLRGRAPLHMGQGPGLSNYVIGQAAGAEAATLTANQIPSHTHLAAAQTAAGTQTGPTNAIWAASTLNQFTPTPPTAAMSQGAVGAAGGNQPHENRMPYLAINFIIALEGIFPTQS